MNDGRTAADKARLHPWGARLLSAVPAAMLLALLARRVWDVDIFWQLKLGELILAQHGPVRTEPFAALHLGEPLPSVAWLGQAAMAGVRLLGGWTLLRLFDALCWLGGFLAVAAACRWRGASLPAVTLALVLAFAAALPTASIRPQSLAALCFGLLLALQRLELRPAVTIALGVPLLVAWQNLHPSEGVGVLALGLSAAIGWVRRLRGAQEPAPVAATVLAFAGCAGFFATPDGLSILAVSARNAEASVAIGASEWLPLWASDNHANAARVLGVALLVLPLVVRHSRRTTASEVALIFALSLLTISAYRFVLFWAVALVPLVARAASAGGPDKGPANGKVAPLLVLLVAVAGPLALPTRFVETLPLAAIERLRQEHLRGTVYADFPYGGPIIDAGYPDWRVAYDGRYYRYSRDEWRYNGGIENGFVPLVDIERKWQPVAFVLDVRHNAPIARELARRRDWRRVYGDGQVVVYVKARR